MIASIKITIWTAIHAGLAVILLAQEPSSPTLPADVRDRIEKALQEKDYKRAEQLLVDEIERNPGARDLLIFAARLFFIDNQPLNAAIALERAERIAPLEISHRFTLAMSYVALKLHDRARAQLHRLAVEAPANALYPYWLGRLDYDSQLFEAALVNFDKALAIDSEFMRAHDNRGLCLEALGRLEDALAAYRKAAELNRRGVRSPWPPHNLGVLLRKLGYTKEADVVLRESIRYDPRFPKARYQLGLLLEKKGKLQEAVAELERAVSLDAAYAQPLYALGRIAQKMGDRERAAEAFAAFKKLNREQREGGPPEAQSLSQEAGERGRP